MAVSDYVRLGENNILNLNISQHNNVNNSRPVWATFSDDASVAWHHPRRNPTAVDAEDTRFRTVELGGRVFIAGPIPACCACGVFFRSDLEEREGVCV